LPAGSGTAIAGEILFQQQCTSSHWDKGQSAIANQLVGGDALNTSSPMKTVGSFWPYSITIFDYTRRIMPHNAPQSLTDDQVYAGGDSLHFIFEHNRCQRCRDGCQLLGFSENAKQG